MNRLSVTLSAALCALAVMAAPSLASDYDCPPGAKFCPAPGLSGGNSYGGGGSSDFGMMPMASAGAAQSHFESQLNEGEQLIMVAPNERNGIIITPNPAAYADSGFSGNGYASGFDSYSSGDSYSMDSYSSPTYSDSGVYSDPSYSSGTYSSSAVDSYSSGGYIPPPPGGGFSPMQEAAQTSFSPMPSDNLAMQPMDSGRNYRQKNPERQPESVRTPKSFQRDYHKSDAPAGDYGAYDDNYNNNDYNDSPRPSMASARRKSDTIPSREDVSKTRSRKSQPDDDYENRGRYSDRSPSEERDSRRGGGYSPASYGDGGKAQASADRVPWWKGGMWRNRKADKAAKAESRERNKAQAKAGSRQEFRTW